MATIPVKFRRVSVAFDEMARARLFESSGSEHSLESFTDLSNLVNSFIERDGGAEGDEEEVEGNVPERESFWCDDDEKKEDLKSLFGRKENSGKRRIIEEMKVACRNLDRSSQGFKRKLMTHLRDRGFDAGLCKSQWEKTRWIAGSYEYIDVNLGGNRYIVEANLASEFEIVRPTDSYLSLLEVFPPIFVGKPEKLKQIIRLMCVAARESIKKADLLVPPWRKNGHMQAKWFSAYKRTTNAIRAGKSKTEMDFPANQTIGFVTMLVRPYACRQDHFAGKVDLNVGQLTATEEGQKMLVY